MTTLSIGRDKAAAWSAARSSLHVDELQVQPVSDSGCVGGGGHGGGAGGAQGARGDECSLQTSRGSNGEAGAVLSLKYIPGLFTCGCGHIIDDIARRRPNSQRRQQQLRQLHKPPRGGAARRDACLCCYTGGFATARAPRMLLIGAVRD